MKIVTIHPTYALDKSFFTRDLGQIGFTLQESLSLPSEVRCLGKVYEQNFIVQGQRRLGFTKRGLLIHLWKHAKDITLLHTYHIRHWSLFYLIIYKLRNKEGISYLKLDTPYDRKNDIMFIFTRPILGLVDMIGVEDKRLLTELVSKYKSNSFIFTPSGTIDLEEFHGITTKKKQIALIGRFGVPVKNYELFIDMLSNYDTTFLAGWTIIFLGSYTNEFKQKIDALLLLKPELEKNILYPGFIQKKTELYTYLIESKIVVHTSNYEGDPNFQYDSMFCGCFLVSTDVGNISQNYPQEFSILYPPQDTQKLFHALYQGIEKTDKLVNNDYLSIQKKCLESFTWKKVLHPIISYVGKT